MKTPDYSRFLGCRAAKQRGVALIATLVFIFILTIIVVLFLNEVEDRIRYRAQTSGDEELRKIAYDYLEYTKGVLEEFKTYDSPFISEAQGWGSPLDYEPFPIEYEGLVATVVVEDATDKIPLNLLDENTFVVLLESLGIDGFSGARLRDIYFDWIDADDDTLVQGAEAREYELERSKFLSPANARMEDVNDFQYLIGFSDWLDPMSKDYNPALYHAFVDRVTVEHDYPVNLNVASPEILAFFELLNRMNPDGIQRYLWGKDQIPNTEDDRMIDLSSSDLPSQLKNALGDTTESALFSSETKVCRIRIDLVRYDSYVFHLEALVDLGGASNAPGVPEEGGNARGAKTETVAPESKTNESGLTQPKTKTISSNSSFEFLVIKEKL